MALSGSFSKSIVNGHYVLRVDWSATQSVANNTSVVTVKAYLVNDWALEVGSRYNNALSVAGVSTTYTSPAIRSTGTHLLTTYTSGAIAHNDDGTKSVAISVTYRINATINGTYYGPMTASQTVTLDTIARASQPSCVTWPEHTQNVGSFGDTISIHMNRKASSFTHTVRYAFGSQSGTIATGVTTGTTWTIPLTLMNLIPSTTSGSGTIYVDTYNGSTKIGTKYCGFTATVPASVKPSCTLTLDDIVGIDDIYGSPVQGLSNIKVKVNPSTAYNSPIKAYLINVNGAKYTAAEATTGVLPSSGDVPVSATVTDARGRTGSASYTMKVQAYTKPSVSAVTVRRCNADGSDNDQGDYVRIAVTAAVSSMSSKNTAAYTLRYKKTSVETWTSVTQDANGKTLASLANKYSLAGEAFVLAVDSNNSYDIEFTATDRHASASRATSVSTAFTLMNWGPEGNNMGIGKVAEKPNTLEVGLQLELSGGILPVEIVANESLNADKYKVSGWYRCPLSSTVESLTNCPTDKAFVMEVLPNVPTTQRITEYVDDQTPRIFVRNYYDYKDVWGAWYEIVPRQNKIATKVSLISLSGSYTFPSDGYLVLRAHYSLDSYVNCVVSGSNGVGFRLTATSGVGDSLVGNPTDALFVRKGMTVSSVDTNDTSSNALEFHPLY